LENPSTSFQNIQSMKQSYDSAQKIVRTISQDISIRNGKYGDYIYHKTTEMKKPSFLKLKGFQGGDYKTCSGEVLRDWIHATYSV
jgi:hypothetical protein